MFFFDKKPPHLMWGFIDYKLFITIQYGIACLLDVLKNT